MKEYIIKINEDKKDIMGNYPLVEKPQELVRCRDCRNYYKGHCQCDDTIYWNREPDFYCADGEGR